MSRLLFRPLQCPPVFSTSTVQLTARTWTRNQTGRFFSSAGRQTGQSTSRRTWFGIVAAGIAGAAVVASQRKVYLDAPSTQEVASQGTEPQSTEEVVGALSLVARRVRLADVVFSGHSNFNSVPQNTRCSIQG
jgi:hypothetical protein